MKKLYCMKCGRKCNIKFGMMPKKCSCNAEFKLKNTKSVKKIIGSGIFFLVLMLPPFVLVYFCRQYLQDSIILYTLALIMIVVWYRIVETVFIRFGLVTMTNIEIR